MLHFAALALTLLVAVLHLGFMVLETFLWEGPTGRRIFGQTVEQAESTKVLAHNQGVYNGALAVLIAWAALSDQHATVVALLVFVIVVGVYGGFTAKRSILVTQAVPAAIALALTLLAH
jgi:putative membrane protein